MTDSVLFSSAERKKHYRSGEPNILVAYALVIYCNKILILILMLATCELGKKLRNLYNIDLSYLNYVSYIISLLFNSQSVCVSAI